MFKIFKKKEVNLVHPLYETKLMLTRLMYELVGQNCHFDIIIESKALVLDSEDPRAILAWSELQLAYQSLVTGEATPELPERLSSGDTAGDRGIFS